jgi:alcohol dehydrogenase (NADP+)
MADLMSQKQYAMGVRSPSDKLELIEFTPPALGDKEVFVDVLYGGMCHSDLHKMLNEWNESTYPLVPGE